MRRAQLRLKLIAFGMLSDLWDERSLADRGTGAYPFTHIGFVPLANLAAIFYSAVIAYSLLQHQFLDMHVTLRRAPAQAARLGVSSFSRG